MLVIEYKPGMLLEEQLKKGEFLGRKTITEKLSMYKKIKGLGRKLVREYDRQKDLKAKYPKLYNYRHNMLKGFDLLLGDNSDSFELRERG